MKTEIITVGTEILLGEITNTNARYLAEQCARNGLDVYFQTVVGDNMGRLQSALRLASERAEMIICTGGLGPTDDDLTKPALAKHLDVDLQLDEVAATKIELFFKDRNVSMSANNLRQAQVLECGDILPNDNGLAVGVAIVKEGVSYILLPGPPRELKMMFEQHAIPWIRARHPQLPVLQTKMLCLAGIGESLVAEKLSDLIAEQSDPTIATYAQEGEVHVRVASKSVSQIEPLVYVISERLNDYLYSYEEKTLEQMIVERFTKQGWTISVAESCTGGLLAQLLTSIPGSSAVFQGGLVAYSNRMKEDWLGVPSDYLTGKDSPGAVSAQTASFMAERLIERMSTDFAIAVTGVAGPGQSERKPVGLVYVAISGKGRLTQVDEYRTSGPRSIIQIRSAKFALFKLWQYFKILL